MCQIDFPNEAHVHIFPGLHKMQLASFLGYVYFCTIILK